MKQHTQGKQSPQKIGSYHLVRLLGQGGCGRVYLGEHPYLGTQVAIKVLLGTLDKQNVQAFVQEARRIALLKHPNILRVFDFGMDDAAPYLVMDYASRGTLRDQYARGTRVEPVQVIGYIRQVAAALQHAHERQLIHRDIKPENILLDADGTLLLSDFGIAAIAHSTLSLKTMDAPGTPAYMAPEQWQGKPHRASDQYALAVVVYEWLTGVRPFSGTLHELMGQHLTTPPPPLRSRRPDLSPQAEQVVLKALAKEPHQRYPTIMQFAEALEQAVQGAQQRRHISPSADASLTFPEASPSLQASPTVSPNISRPSLGSNIGARAIALSPDSRFLAACEWDGHIAIWETATGVLVSHYEKYNSSDAESITKDSR